MHDDTARMPTLTEGAARPNDRRVERTTKEVKSFIVADDVDNDAERRRR